MSGSGFNLTTGGASIKRSAVLNAGTVDQAPGDAVWITSAGTFDLGIVVEDGSTLECTGSGATTNPTILPCAATRYINNSGTVVVKNVWVSK